MVYIGQTIIIKKMNMDNTQKIQMAMSRLLMHIIKADLRALQMKIRKSEYNILINVCVEAEQYGLDTSKLRQASDDIANEVTPYTEHPGKNAPEIMLSLTEGLEQVIEGYGTREPERVALLNSVMQNCMRQKKYMFEAIQQGVNPEKILFLTDTFIKRYKGCQEYNQRIIDIIINSFEANDNAHVLKSVTAYMILLEFVSSYASYNDDSMVLFAYQQRLKAMTDAAGTIRVIYLDFKQDGMFHESMQQQNRDSYEEQGRRLNSLKNLEAEATFRYISGILTASETKIQKFYREAGARSNSSLMQEVGMKLREGFYNNLFGSIQNNFLKIIVENRKLIDSLTQNGTRNNFIEDSPINILLEHMSHNPISSTNHARNTNRDFESTLKRVLVSDKKFENIITTPRFKGTRETAAMNPGNRAAEGLVNNIQMELDDVRDEFQGMREELNYTVRIFGEYILTRSDYREYPAEIPVIQIQDYTTGSLIVGANANAYRLGFSQNLFITSIEQVDFDEIEDFMKDSGRGAAGGMRKFTRFRLVALARPKQDLEDKDEELMKEALDDQTPVLDDTFFDLIK